MTDPVFFDPCGNRIEETRQFIYNSTEVWAEWGFPSEEILFLMAWNSVNPWQMHQSGLPSFCYCTVYNNKGKRTGNRLHFAYEFGKMLAGFAQNVGFDSLKDKRQCNPDDLYFIQETETGNIKIGRSQDPSARLKTLQIANAKALNLVKVLPGKGYLEKDFHHKYRDAKIASEWFRPTAELLKYIRQNGRLSSMKLSQSVVQMLVESDEAFPVDLDDAWKWLGFTSKRAAKQLLLDAFEPELDFLRNLPKATGGRPSEVFTLTVDCFKSLGMMANTPKGREVRKHFLECERQVKQMQRSQPLEPRPESSAPALAALSPAPGWKPEVWEVLPPEDRRYFSETPEEKARRVDYERKELARFLSRADM